MLDRTVEEFYKVYEIEPCIRKGQTYMSGDMRLAQVTAQEDMYPKLYDYTYLRLLTLIYQGEFNAIYTNGFRIPSDITLNTLKELILEHLISFEDKYNHERVREIVNAPMNVEVI